MAGGYVVNNGRKIMLDRTYNVSPTRTAPTKFSVGIGTTAATTSDTGIEYRVPITGTETVDSCDVTTGWSAGTDSAVSQNGTTYKEGTASLNITKSGTSGSTASASKTTTNIATFASKELSIWVYISDLADLHATNSVIVRFGNDSSNYYYWNVNKSTFATGWNLIDKKTTANASGTTGSPSTTNCDYTAVLFTAASSGTTWSAGDCAIDDIKVVSSDDYYKNFEAGYPQLDYTAIQCTIRARLSTVQSNGYEISEFGIFNTDSTPLMESHDVFTGISKGDSDEIIFVTKTKVE